MGHVPTLGTISLLRTAAGRESVAGASRRPEIELISIMRQAARANAIDLAVGVPGFDPDPRLVECLFSALHRGMHQYADPAGSVLLREAIARSLEDLRGTRVSIDDITVTCGATEALSLALHAVVEPGDEVIMFEPTYEAFVHTALTCGARVRRVSLEPPEWTFDADELADVFTPSTRAIVINTPHNPTGKVFERHLLAQIGALCAERNVFCISDEVYEAFEGAAIHVSALEVEEFSGRALLVGSFSKTLAVSGWRVGYLVTPRAITRRVRELHQITTAGAPSAAQDALGRFVSETSIYRLARATAATHVHAQATRAISMFDRPDVRPMPGQGGCFFVAELACESAMSFCGRLIEEHGVAIAPGTAFWADPSLGSRYVRVAFNKSAATITHAAGRLSGLRS